MHCYQVDEDAQLGMPLGRQGKDVFIPPPPECRLLMLHQTLVEDVLLLPETASVRLCETALDISDRHITFRPKGKREELSALVRLRTRAGEGGKVILSANSFNSVLKKHRVQREYRPFPDAGLVPYCTKKMVDDVNRGVDELDVLLLMYQGSSFRIYRTGRLPYTSRRVIFLHWNGRELRIGPERQEDRAFFETAAAG